MHLSRGHRKDLRGGAAFFKDMDVKQAFHEGADQGQIAGILAEREEWEVVGYRQWCFAKLLTCFSCDIGLPEGHTCTTNKLNVMVQASPSHHTSSSQISPPPLLVNAGA